MNATKTQEKATSTSPQNEFAEDSSLQETALPDDQERGDQVDTLEKGHAQVDRTQKDSTEPPYSVFSSGEKKFIVIMASLAALFSPLSANICKYLIPCPSQILILVYHRLSCPWYSSRRSTRFQFAY